MSPTERAAAAAKLMDLEKKRATLISFRNTLANSLRARVAGQLLGCHNGLPEKERKAKHKEADRLVARLSADPLSHGWGVIVQKLNESPTEMLAEQEKVEDDMEGIAAGLPAAGWATAPEQRGFGLLRLAVVVGECGDLSNYPNPGKVWRRMGCAPFTSGGLTRMGSTWRGKREGKLEPGEWSEYGYSPRRRSIMFVVGDLLNKQNGDGPYRQRYLSKKAELQAAHPDYPKMRCHLHGLLLASKLLLKNLWIEWNQDRGGDEERATDPSIAAAV